MTKILNIGFFNRDNTGDDALELVLGRVIKNYDNSIEITNKSIDSPNLSTSIKNDGYDIILFGGGDTINDYFLNKFIRCLDDDDTRIPIYAISVGIPYHSYLEERTVNVFDKMLLRNQDDYTVMQNILGPSHVHKIPDIVFGLPQLIDLPSLPPLPQPIIDFTQTGRTIIGVYLTRPIFANNPNYKSIIQKLALILETTIQQHNASIILVPFNKQLDNRNECDFYINLDILSMINPKYKNHVLSINSRSVTPTFIYQITSLTHLSICSRFHAHVYSIMCKKPFISLCHTSKVQKLLKDYNLLPYVVEYDRDKQNIPKNNRAI